MRYPAADYFRSLHVQAAPLLVPTIWDARSAAVAEAAGFAVVGTSSAAMASMLGYPDGEQLPFAELRYLVGRIRASTRLPLSVDLEGGYSRNPAQIAAHVLELARLGVAGINLEDSVVVEGKRQLLPAAQFAQMLRTVRELCRAQNQDVFFNIRTDTYLLPTGNPLAATLERLPQYQAAGADGLFVPGLTELSEIRTLSGATHLPLNVMCLPTLPDFAQLQVAGVRRISLGNFLFEALADYQRQLSLRLQTEQTGTALFA